MMWEFVSPVSILIGLLASIVTTVWFARGWFANQFSDLRKMVYQIEEKIISKLEYHEKHDDTRFQSLQNDLWAIKVRNASADDFARRLILEKDKLNSGS